MTRAQRFYSAVFGAKVTIRQLGECAVGLLHVGGDQLPLRLVHGPGFVPTPNGALVVVSVAQELTHTLEVAAEHGAELLTLKTFMGPQIGNLATLIDTEGNRLCLHEATSATSRK